MEWFILVLLGIIWGASYLFIKVGGAEIPPFTFVAGRTTIASIALVLVLLARREKLPSFRSPIWRWFVILGILNGVIPYTLITWGETHIASGLAAIIIGTMPIFTVLLAHWLTADEQLNANKLVGILIGFCGVVLLFLPELGGGLQLTVVGELAVLGAAISYALAIVVARKYLRGVGHITASFGQLASASLILIPLAILIDHPSDLHPSQAAIASLLTLSLVGTAFAYLLYYWLIENVGATQTSLVTYISPVAAVILGALILGESLNWTSLGGLAAIIAGVALVTRKTVSNPQLAPLEGE